MPQNQRKENRDRYQSEDLHGVTGVIGGED
jgi:hypothetical protein